MELAKLVLKTIYLFILFVLCYTIVTSKIQTSKTNIIMISFLISILGVYFTFGFIYNYLTHSEVIFKKKDEDENKHSKDEHPHDDHPHENKNVKDFVFDHTQYIHNQVFEHSST